MTKCSTRQKRVRGLETGTQQYRGPYICGVVAADLPNRKVQVWQWQGKADKPMERQE